jgi:putative phosphoesterase
VTLGILSDTHGYLPPTTASDLAGVDAILHAGDIGTLGVLDALKEIAPVYGVWGNIDGQQIRSHTSEHLRLNLGGLRVWMTHIAGRPGRWQRGMGERLAHDPPDLFICGHSHILRIERVPKMGGMLYVNPGAAGRQGFHQVKTCVRLRLERGKVTHAEVVHLEAK